MEDLVKKSYEETVKGIARLQNEVEKEIEPGQDAKQIAFNYASTCFMKLRQLEYLVDVQVKFYKDMLKIGNRSVYDLPADTFGTKEFFCIINKIIEIDAVWLMNPVVTSISHKGRIYKIETKGKKLYQVIKELHEKIRDKEFLKDDES